MSLASRGTRAAARPLRHNQQQRTSALRNSTRRRNASSHDAHHDAGHGEGAHHAESGGSGNEGFGKGFYITLAAIPTFYLGYTLSRSDNNTVQKWYDDYQAGLAKEKARDVLHATAMEQAISDRAVLYGAKTNHSRELRYTEFFNQGSPWNVAAGEGTADLSKLAQHYDEQIKKIDSARTERMSAK